MSASNPFFGQSVVSVDRQAKVIVASFPNWGIMDENNFRAAVEKRLRTRHVKSRKITVMRLNAGADVDPTFWVIKIE